MSLHIPNALTVLRLALSPALVLVAFTGRAWSVLGLLLFLQITDWVDGPLARRSGQVSEAGAKLDSLADSIMFAAALGALVVLEGPLLLDEWPWMAVAVATYVVSALYGLARFGVIPTYHQWSAKISGPLTLLAVFAVLVVGVAWPVRVAAAAVTLGNLEALWITRRLDAPATDVPSVLVLPPPSEARRRARRWPWVLGGAVVSWLVVWFVVIPYPRGLATGDPGVTALMEQRIREARAAGDTLVIRRTWVDLEGISPNVRRAVVVAEDYRFRAHQGVDWVSLAEEVQWTGGDDFTWLSPGDLGALARALAYAWEHRAELRGRSTITQQLAKNLYFGTDRSFLRKAMELVVARRLERSLDKDRILELYLNVAEWGPGIFGVEAAARRYFGRLAVDLTLSQAAALAGTLPHPLTSNPAYRPGQMAWRRDLILSRLSPSGPAVPGPIPEPPPALVLPDSLLREPAGPDVEEDPAPDSSVTPPRGGGA